MWETVGRQREGGVSPPGLLKAFTTVIGALRISNCRKSGQRRVDLASRELRVSGGAGGTQPQGHALSPAICGLSFPFFFFSFILFYLFFLFCLFCLF